MRHSSKNIIHIFDCRFRVDPRGNKTSFNCTFVFDLHDILMNNDSILDLVLNANQDIDVMNTDTRCLIMTVNTSAVCQGKDKFKEDIGKKICTVKAYRKANKKLIKLIKMMNDFNSNRIKKMNNLAEAINKQISAQSNYLNKINQE